MTNFHEFSFMRRGKWLKSLSEEDKNLIKAIDKREEDTESALLLLHGFSSTPAVFRNIIPKISDCYDAIMVPALPGHAESIEAFSKVKHTDWIKASENACEALLKKYQKVDVLGLSLGGLLACNLTQKYSLNHAFLLAPALDLHLPLSLCLPLANVLNFLGFKKIRNAGGDINDDKMSDIAYNFIPVHSIIEIFTFIKNFMYLGPQCPTDVFLGKSDSVVHSKRVAARFANSSLVEIHWLNNSAHVLALDYDFNAIIECVKAKSET